MELNEEKLKEILEGQRKEYQNYTGILVESFESQVKIIAESLSGVQQQLNAIKEMVARNTEDIMIMKRDMLAMKKDMEIIKMDIQIIKQDLKRKVDMDEFGNLERRVALLEKRGR